MTMLAGWAWMVLRGQAVAPTVLPLWEKGAPGFENRRMEPEEAKEYWVKNIHNPSIAVYLPPKERATGAAVLIAPGGGHSLLVYDAEGTEPAKYLAAHGIAAIVLKYRLGRGPGTPYKIEVHAKEDGYRAMRQIRAHATEWGIDPKRVGFLGFSAGGEVVSMISYASGAGDPNAIDPVDRQNGRPDYQLLVYPGPIGIPDVVPADAPPAFLLVSNDDDHSDFVVDLMNKYRKAKASVEVHILARGGHGFNMGNRSKLSSVNTWPQRMLDWLGDSGFLGGRSGS